MVTTEDEDISTNITLLFKNGRVTILILVAPSAPFSAIKTELLSTLQERYPDGLPAPNSTLPPDSPTPNSTNVPIPESILDLILGVLKDENDPAQGWNELILHGGGMADNPRNLGLRDGSVIAFRFSDDDDELEAEEDSFDVTWAIFGDNDSEPDSMQFDDEMEDEGEVEYEG